MDIFNKNEIEKNLAKAKKTRKVLLIVALLLICLGVGLEIFATIKILVDMQKYYGGFPSSYEQIMEFTDNYISGNLIEFPYGQLIGFASEFSFAFISAGIVLFIIRTIIYGRRVKAFSAIKDLSDKGFNPNDMFKGGAPFKDFNQDNSGEVPPVMDVPSEEIKKTHEDELIESYQDLFNKGLISKEDFEKIKEQYKK